MKSSYKIFILAFFGFLSALAMLIYQHKATPEEPHMIAPPAENIFVNSVAGTGIIEAIDDNIALGIQIPGVVKETYVTVGQAIEKGSPLLLIDDDQIRADIAVEGKNLSASWESLTKTVSLYLRMKAVKEVRAISQEDLDNRLHDMKIAREAYLAEKLKVDSLKVTLSKHLVISPKKGVVKRFIPRAGVYASNMPQEVASGNSSNEAPIIIGSDGMQVRIDVDEENAGRVRPGNSAYAYTKGINKVLLDLDFIRIEPFCVPKTSLTGASDERVDTRVLQLIYAIVKIPQDKRIYVGQQIDAFIEADPINK